MGWCRHCSKNTESVRDHIDGFICCAGCGRVIDQDNFTTDVTFIKGAGGQSQMAGNYVKTMQGEYSESHERTLNNGRYLIDEMVQSLTISGGDSVVDPASNLYKIAVERNFTRGRRTSQVAAACLYIICREKKKSYLLIDFSEHLGINVYVLGAVFLQLCKLLRLEEHPLVQKPVDPSLFIHRFTERLLKEKNVEVSRAALRIIASMKRDWMQTGRKPSGLCGAAIYIAALAHGLRYTKSDVISVVRICEATLTKRLIEFENTASGGLTIEEFYTKSEEVELLSRQELNAGSKVLGTTELLCEHKDRGDAHFAHGLCKLCYQDFVELSGGLQGESEPPAFQRAERERMAKASAASEVEESSPGSTSYHSDNGQKQFERGEKSAREKPPDVIENDRIGSGAAPEDHVSQNGSCQSQGDGDRDNVAGDESESLSDIDDVEVDGYLHNEEEKHYKKIIWEEMNREYLEEQAAKEAAAAATREAQESDLQNCSEELRNARQLAAATAAALEKSRKEKKQKRTANYNNRNPARTAAEAASEMLSRKRLSSKINFEVLETLFEDSTAPENSKRKRVESDPDNDASGLQSHDLGEKEQVSDLVDNVDDYGEDDYEEGDGGIAYGDGSYYGNEEDGYGYDDNGDY